MELCKSVKTKLYPNASQKADLFRMFNADRFIFNQSQKELLRNNQELSKIKSVETKIRPFTAQVYEAERTTSCKAS